MHNDIRPKSSTKELEKKIRTSMREQGRSEEDINNLLGFIGIEGYKQKGFWKKFIDSLF